jgi:serine/threonine-protein kinase
MAEEWKPIEGDEPFPEESLGAGVLRFSSQLLATVVKSAVLILGVLGTAVFISYFAREVYTSYFQVPDEVEVPKIVGREVTDANRILESVGLRLNVQESRYTSKIPDRVIMSQTPAAGRKVRQNREILAVVSLGPELVDVPDLRGKTLREARILLSNGKLKLGKVVYKKGDQGQPEQVLNQKPAAGDRVSKGQAVNLEVQKGSGSSS